MLKRIKASFSRAAERRAYRTLKDQGYRIVRISFPDRIGHLSIEVDAFLKDTILAGGDIGPLFLPDLGEGFANRHLVDYFRRYITIRPAPALVRYMEAPTGPTDTIVETHPYAVAMYTSAKVFDVYARWASRPPLFELSEDDDAALRDFKTAVEMPQDAWFVCLHAREGGYSPIDEAIHKFRSVTIESYMRAVDTIVARGGWVIRIGDASMRPVAPRRNLIDYALSPQKSAQLDVALAARCRFFLGSSSGPTALATIFGRPCVIAHMAPLGASLGVSPQDISLPQHLRDQAGAVLDARAIMDSRYSHFRLNEEFIAHGLVNEPNSPEEIDEAAQEMLDRLDGILTYSADDEMLQDTFKQLFRSDHYAHGYGSRIGRDFLRRTFRAC